MGLSSNFNFNKNPFFRAAERPMGNYGQAEQQCLLGVQMASLKCCDFQMCPVFVFGQPPEAWQPYIMGALARLWPVGILRRPAGILL